jgi:hypothetical protein
MVFERFSDGVQPMLSVLKMVPINTWVFANEPTEFGVFVIVAKRAGSNNVEDSDQLR